MSVINADARGSRRADCRGEDRGSYEPGQRGSYELRPGPAQYPGRTGGASSVRDRCRRVRRAAPLSGGPAYRHAGYGVAVLIRHAHGELLRGLATRGSLLTVTTHLGEGAGCIRRWRRRNVMNTIGAPVSGFTPRTSTRCGSDAD